MVWSFRSHFVTSWYTITTVAFYILKWLTRQVNAFCKYDHDKDARLITHAYTT